MDISTNNIIKVAYCLISIIVFSFIYSLFPNEAFGGVINSAHNKAKEHSEEHKTQENALLLEFNQNNHSLTNFFTLNNYVYNKNGLNVYNYFDRLYFSIITQTTIGFGDIYPATRELRFIVSLQALSTIFLLFI